MSTTNATKVYGADIQNDIANNYTITGLNAGVSNAYLADNAAHVFSGTPSVTSLGAPATASVGRYTVSANGLLSLARYGINYNNVGRLNVTPATPTSSETSSPASVFKGTLDIAASGENTIGLVSAESVAYTPLETPLRRLVPDSVSIENTYEE